MMPSRAVPTPPAGPVAPRAGAVLVLIPIKPTLPVAIRDQAETLARRALAHLPGSRVVFDLSGEAPPRGTSFPYRLPPLARIRQNMVDKYLAAERWVFWVDVDIVDYNEDLVLKLIERAEGGIAAPLVLMEGDVREPPCNPDGFGPGRFYDIAGFSEEGRWARFVPPYFNQVGPVFDLDSVGCCYLVTATAHFIANQLDWPADIVARNQAGPANSFSDHYTICEFARRHGLPVRAFADLVVYHQREG